MDDLHFLLTMTRDPDVMRYIGQGRIWSEAETRDLLAKIIDGYTQSDHTGLLLTVRRNDNEPIGHAGLINQTIEDERETEVGYWIARKNWGQGYATEAARGCRD